MPNTSLHTKKALSDTFKKIPNSIRLVSPIHIRWERKGIGFGELYFYEKGKKIHCANELMDKTFIKAILNDMIDKCILDEERKPV